MAMPSETDQVFEFENPWRVESAEACYFYHTMKYPDGEIQPGSWTIDDFPNYIGSYDLTNKSVLDVGTASGFLAFQAEQAGAIVTATDARIAKEYKLIPFQNTPYMNDIMAWRRTIESDLFKKMRSSFWYSWRKYNSRVKVAYCSTYDLIEVGARFDVVIAGAIIEHLSDPVSAIGGFAKLAKEAVIIAFTPVVDTDELLMRPILDWTDPNYNYVWWQLSRGLYARIFDNLGFDIEIVMARASQNAGGGVVHTVRPTIIARRRR
jgi:SAM-dependent methyltransferase